ncbi:MAG: hypothetical protein RLZZ70_679 [Candidatus Parcubacteria bacterium]|jgi:hypothetical protein
MDHLRVLTLEEVKAREADEKEKQKLKDERRERLRAIRAKKKGKK